VLRGVADEQLLDTYGLERAPHVRYFIDVSIGLGRVICVPGQADAAERDKQMIAQLENPRLAPPPPPPPRLGPGLLAADDPHAGLLAIQSRVTYGNVEGLFDDVVGRGWFILTTAPEVPLPAAAQDTLKRIGARVLRIGPPGSAGIDLGDVDGRYLDWLAELGADTVIVRPDFYVYAAADAALVAPLLAQLDAQLSGSAMSAAV